MGTIQDGNYISQYTGDQIDAALGKALNPDTAPTANSANLITSGGVYGGLQRKSNPNLLDNWYFVGGGSQQGGGQFPINQRGQTSYTGDGYAVDRWKMTGAIAMNSDEVELSFSAPYSYGILYQVMEQCVAEFTKGRNVTFSALVNGHLVSHTWNIPNQFPNAGNVVPIYLTDDCWVQIYSQDGVTYTLGIAINSDFPNPIAIKAVKLELCDTQTLAHQENGFWVLNDPPPNYATELAKCQRYYQLYATQSLRPSNALDCRPVMRTTPAQGTISVDGTTYYYNDANL